MENNKKVGRFGVSSIILGSAVLTPTIFLFVFPLLQRFVEGEHLISALDNIFSTDDGGRVVIGVIGAGIFGTLAVLIWLVVHKKEKAWDLRSIIIRLIIIGVLASLLPTFLASIMSG